ncbi:MAG: hypothetical protein K940chlam2_01813 [Chlamydiae bacterium]|nr:hypothetical protein [Chlamydiota bacterium]
MFIGNLIVATLSAALTGVLAYLAFDDAGLAIVIVLALITIITAIDGVVRK